jgi:hypothetical protein
MPSTNRTTNRLAALTEARPVASPAATLMGLLHVLERAAEEAERIGLAQTADGLGALGRFCAAEFRARHGLTH